MSDLPPIDRPVVMPSGGGERRGRPQKPNAAVVTESILVVCAVWLVFASLVSGTAYLFAAFWCCLPVPLFLFFVGVFALVDGVRMLMSRHRGRPRIYGLLFLLAVLTCWDVLTVLCGIAILVLCDTPTAREWYGYDRMADSFR